MAHGNKMFVTSTIVTWSIFCMKTFNSPPCNLSSWVSCGTSSQREWYFQFIHIVHHHFHSHLWWWCFYPFLYRLVCLWLASWCFFIELELAIRGLLCWFFLPWELFSWSSCQTILLATLQSFSPKVSLLFIYQRLWFL